MRTRHKFQDEQSGSILFAATAGALEPKEQQRLIRMVQAGDPFGGVLTRFMAVFGVSAFLLYAVLSLFHFSMDAAMPVAMVLAPLIAGSYCKTRAMKERRRMASILYKRNVRPRLCLICTKNLRHVEDDSCPKCHASLAQLVVADDV